MNIVDWISQRLQKIIPITARDNAPVEEEEDPWRKIFEKNDRQWKRAVRRAHNGPTILLPTGIGGHKIVIQIEKLLAVALTLRGADVHFLLCDRVLPGCMMATTTDYRDQSEFPKHGPQKSLCDGCFSYGYSAYRQLGIPIHLYSEFLTAEEQQTARTLAHSLPVEQIVRYSPDGLAVGEHSLAGALRYFAKATLEGERYGEAVLRWYFHAALLTKSVMERIAENIPVETAVFHHGIYIPQGIVGEVCRKHHINVVNWNPAYRKQCFIFSHRDTYHHALMSEPVNNWENLPWDERTEKRLIDYLRSRAVGTQDWIWFHEKPEFDIAAIAGELGVDFSKPTIGLLTNVLWDAQLHYPANAFPSMTDWLVKTIRYFMKRPDLQLVIRIHPAEIRGTLPSRQSVAQVIQAHFRTLPKNIFVIAPDSNVSTYAVMQYCNTVLIYGTKMGVELTSFGIPVIVAGEAWVRNKGITMDAGTEAEYFSFLDRLPAAKKMTKQQIVRARKYAFHFFFRRMIPLKCLEPKDDWPPFRLGISGLDDLLPGKDPGLDVLCEGILKQKEFIYPEEQYL